jgi:hypothetical protein
MQYLLEVYSQESENLSSFSGVDLGAVRPRPVQIEHSRTGRQQLDTPFRAMLQGSMKPSGFIRSKAWADKA